MVRNKVLRPGSASHLATVVEEGNGTKSRALAITLAVVQQQGASERENEYFKNYSRRRTVSMLLFCFRTLAFSALFF
jgi:hypothetical protein